MEATTSTFSLQCYLPSLLCPFRLPSSNPPPSIRLPLSSSPSKLTFSLSTYSSLLLPVSFRRRFTVPATVEELTATQEEQQQEQEQEKVNKPEDTNSDKNKKKLYVVNLPWTIPTATIRNRFQECGPVLSIEMIKDDFGRNKGYAFVTMGTAEAAEAVINKYNLTEFSGRTIKVAFAKSLKPKSLSPSPPPVLETRHKLYVSNLQWKARTSDLREFFSPEFNPVSCKVVFEKGSRRSAGYGFASFATREEAEAAIASLNGKELLGRPIILKFSETKTVESGKEAVVNDASKTNEQINQDSEEAA